MGTDIEVIASPMSFVNLRGSGSYQDLHVVVTRTQEGAGQDVEEYV